MPTLNKNLQDPTGQGRTRESANRTLVRRLEKSRIEVNNAFMRIPRRTASVTKVVNSLEANTTQWIYEIDDQGLQELSLEIARTLEFNLEVGAQKVPPSWYYGAFIETAFRSGALDDFRDTKQAVDEVRREGLIKTPVGPVLVDADIVTQSIEYQRALALEYAQSYENIKTLSQKTAADVYGEIQRGIQAGQNSKTIRQSITKRFSVSKSNAERIARTGVNQAYNDAKLELTDTLEKQFDVKLGSMHISALLATTREDHAKRHSKAFSSVDQLRWWNSGSNRINCYCTTQKVVLDSKGNVLNKELQEEVKKEGDEFFGK